MCGKSYSQILGFSNDHRDKRASEDHNGQRFEIWAVKRTIFVMGSAAQHLIFKLEAIRICRRMGFRRRSIFNVTPWILSFAVTF
jgi:hypothetical protein